jgi:hypothetical protein
MSRKATISHTFNLVFLSLHPLAIFQYVRRGDSQLRGLHRNITDFCQKPKVQEPEVDSEARMARTDATKQLRFSRAALRICQALDAICTATAEIAHHTMLLLEDAGWVPGCEALEKACYLVNRLMCLCIVALFKKERQHAEAVLQNREGRRLFEQSFHELRNAVRKNAIPAALELAITNSLRQIANQTHEIAEAIAFWLEGKKCAVAGASAN